LERIVGSDKGSHDGTNNKDRHNASTYYCQATPAELSPEIKDFLPTQFWLSLLLFCSHVVIHQKGKFLTFKKQSALFLWFI
jgi:hypothetical protein